MTPITDPPVAAAEDPQFHLQNPHPTYTWMRRNDAVHRRGDIRVWLLSR
jgi:hypothetical protein